MKKILLITLCFISLSIKAQYTTYTIDEVGSISVTDDLELQGGNYKEMVDSYLNSRHINFDSRVVFQPKGLNAFDKEVNSYCRIIIETLYGDYEPLYSKIPQISVNELRELSTTMKQSLIQGFAGTSLQLINFYGSTIVKVNNQVAIKTSYTRRLGDNAPVRVDVYHFQNRDRMHSLTLSYRIEDAALWKEKLSHSLNSFKIDKQ
ncbi:hypothetical protein [uncultured Capnocytophaga sp.]|uniref:hypothetical protein n=1 Tax=uncultured Capnocytophaga sp. TaxID=159273 RepID=UPI002604C172|nr:hypothetical protein [uncultured Capnocytophaga sp.]